MQVDDDVLYDQGLSFILMPHKVGFWLLSRRACREDARSETLHPSQEPIRSPALILSALLCVCSREPGSRWCGHPQVKPQ